MFKGFTLTRRALSAALVCAPLVALTPITVAQDAPTTLQAPAQPQQIQTQPAQTDSPAKPTSQVASASAGETVAAKTAAEPLYKAYKGVTLGMSASEVRAKLGKPSEKSNELDFFVFNDHERARVYYKDGKTSAVIATYIGKDAGAPAPAAVLGTEIEAKPDGSLYLMKPYPQAGYWVAYSRTPGDSPMVMITMQKSP